MKSFIPNFITLLNLFMGCIAIYFAAQGDLISAGICSALGIFFDFFDGLAARLLNVSSELGKQLDSLADVVTSGVVPGYIMFQLIQISFATQDALFFSSNSLIFSFFGFLITLASAYRLAKFNIDENQTDKFIGLPTPANTILILSLPFILEYEDITWLNDLILSPSFLIILTILSAYLLNMKLELFSLKLKSLKLKDNVLIYFFLALCITLIILLKFIAVPLIILSYIILSFTNKKIG